MYHIFFFQEADAASRVNPICLDPDQSHAFRSYYFVYRKELAPEAVSQFPESISRDLRDYIIKNIEEINKKNKELGEELREAYRRRHLSLVDATETIEAEAVPVKEKTPSETVETVEPTKQSTLEAKEPKQSLQPTESNEQRLPMTTPQKEQAALERLLEVKKLMAEHNDKEEQDLCSQLTEDFEEQLEHIDLLKERLADVQEERQKVRSEMEKLTATLTELEEAEEDLDHKLQEEVKESEVIEQRLEKIRAQQQQRAKQHRELLDQYQDELQALSQFLHTLGFNKD